MQDDLISIIIPVYNAELYIAKCMKYVQNQTYSNIEIIFIDDGSNDKSRELCREYVERDFRIKYFYKTNGGPASARNVGIRNAHGKYLYFMDVDDKLEENAIELLYQAYQKENVDFVIGNTKRIDIYGNEHIEWKEEDKIFKDRKEVTDFVYEFANDIKSYKILWSAWGKLYCSEIVKKNHVYYNEKVYAWEDVLFVISYLVYCNSVFYVGKCLYTYCHYGQANIASGRSYLGPLDFRYTIKEIKKILNGKRYRQVIGNCYSEYAIWSMFNNIRLMKIHSVQDIRKLYSNIYKIAKDKRLQNSIQYYVQKHNDNARIIPFFIKMGGWIWPIIIIFKLQIRKNEIKSRGK